MVQFSNVGFRHQLLMIKKTYLINYFNPLKINFFVRGLFLFLYLFVFEKIQIEAAPIYVDKQFELPSGFHIYKLAENTATGGSYDIVFDGQGRILGGDTTSVRRLVDKDDDGIYESYEVIATGLGGRGPTIGPIGRGTPRSQRSGG